MQPCPPEPYCAGHQVAEFMAAQTLVRILPRFSVSQPLRFVQGSYGPFRANREAEVPLWLALQLKRMGICAIYPPEWFDAGVLRQKRDEEKALETEFVALPFYFMEIAKLLLTGNNLDQAKEQVDELIALLKDIANIRSEKINHGLPTVRHYVTGIKLNNLTASEIWTTRPVL
eukprot:RCo004653